MKVAGTGAERQSTPPQIAYDNEAEGWRTFFFPSMTKCGNTGKVKLPPILFAIAGVCISASILFRIFRWAFK